MRKLPPRAVKIDKKENISTIASKKKDKVLKTLPKLECTPRRVFADKTNSASDHNKSSSPSPIVPTKNGRPKRCHNMPIRYINHDLSISKKLTKVTSTPLNTKAQKHSFKDQISTIKLKSNTENVNVKNTKKSQKRIKSKNIASCENKNSQNKENVNIPQIKNPTLKKFFSKSRTTPFVPEVQIITFKEQITMNRFKKVAKNVNNSNTKCTTKSPQKIIEHNIKDIVNENIQNEEMKNPIPQKRFFNINKDIKESKFKNKLIVLNDSQMNVSNKLKLYDFKCDPKEKIEKTKKKKTKNINLSSHAIKKKTVRKKKITTKEECDRAMLKMLADLQKIRDAKLFKKLQLIKEQKQKELNQNMNNVNILSKLYNVQGNNPNESVDVPLDSPRACSPVESNADNENVESFDFSINNSTHFLNPIAASSMINDLNEMPSSSPWRVEVDSEPKKWRYNFYVKASMTPAYERDTVHVLGLSDKSYAIDNSVRSSKIPLEPLKDTLNSDKANADKLLNKSPIKEKRALVNNNSINIQNSANLKQSSILSFLENSLKKSHKKSKSKKSSQILNFSNEDFENNYLHIHDVEFNKNNSPITNCFGFEDDSSEFDQENVSPVKIQKLEAIKKKILGNTYNKKSTVKNQNILQRSPNKSVLNEISENSNTKESSINQSSDSENSLNEDTSEISQNTSKVDEVALFEDPGLPDVEIIHYDKPTRKSYERRMRHPVRFQGVEHIENTEGSDTDVSVDYIPKIKTGKIVKTKKKKQTHKPVSKKEQREFDVWATHFNSMLEEAEEFALCVE